MSLFESDQEREERMEKLKESTLERYNVFRGIECDVVLPQKQLMISGKSGTTKGLATLAFGLLGYAAASGTSQNEENRTVETILQIVENGIVFKNANIDGADMRIPYGDIVKMMVPDTKKTKDKAIGIITLIENKRIILIPKTADNDGREIVLNHIWDILNEKAYGVKNEDPGWGLDSERKRAKVVYDESDISELERLGVLFERGLLTEREFKKLKKGVIEK